MLRLTKKTEYALLALRSLARASDMAPTSDAVRGIVTTREIAQRYQIPEMLLAKVLQKLKQQGIVSATKGSGGGYRLARELDALPLLDVLRLFDEHKALVACQDDGGQCPQAARCDIKGPLEVLNEAIMEPLRKMSVRDLFVSDHEVAPRPGPFMMLLG